MNNKGWQVVCFVLLVVGFVAIPVALSLGFAGVAKPWPWWTAFVGVALIVLGVALCIPALIYEKRVKQRIYRRI